MLPPCAAQALHNLHTAEFESQGRAPSSSDSDRSSWSSPGSAGVAILAALLLIGALLAAGVMGQRLWRRTERRPGGGRLELSQMHQEDLRGLLPQSGAGMSASTGRAALGSMAGRGKRSRLAVLLQKAIGDQQEALMMVPMTKLPTALAHQLGSVRKAAASRQRRDSRAAAAAAADGGMQLHELAAALSASSSTANTSDASSWSSRDLELAVFDPVVAGPSSGDSSNSPSGSRAWGLQTTSLQVPLNALSVGGLAAGWRGALALLQCTALWTEHARAQQPLRRPLTPLGCLLPSPMPPQFVTHADGRLVELGAGSHSLVYLAKLQGMDVAVKVCHRSRGEHVGAWRRCYHGPVTGLG